MPCSVCFWVDLFEIVECFDQRVWNFGGFVEDTEGSDWNLARCYLVWTRFEFHWRHCSFPKSSRFSAWMVMIDGNLFQFHPISVVKMLVILGFMFIHFQVSQPVDLWRLSNLHEKQSWRATTDVFTAAGGIGERVSGFCWHKSLHHIFRLSQPLKPYWSCAEWHHCWFWRLDCS